MADARLWRLSAGSGLLMGAQFTVLAAVPLFATTSAAASERSIGLAVGGVYAVSILTRLVAGLRSDRSRRRVAPIRTLAWLGSAALGAGAFLAGIDPTVALVPLLAAAVLLLTWNGLAFAAAGELASPARAGEAIAVLTTVLYAAAAAAPPLANLGADHAGWPAALGTAALAPAAAWYLLRPLTQTPPSGGTHQS